MKLSRVRVFKTLFGLIAFASLYLLGGTLASFLYFYLADYSKESVVKSHNQNDHRLFIEFYPGSEFSTFGAPFSSVKKETKYKINSWGLREREFSAKKEPGVFRILVMGDSITYGADSKQDLRYTEVLQVKLNEWSKESSLNLEFELINAGITGTNTLGQLYLYKEKLKSIEVDYVLWALFSNDWQNDQYLWSRWERFDKKYAHIFLPGAYLAINYLSKSLGFSEYPFLKFAWSDFDRKHFLDRKKYERENVIEPLAQFRREYPDIRLGLLLISSPVFENKNHKFTDISPQIIEIKEEFDYTEISSISDFLIEAGVDNHLNVKGHERVGEIIYPKIKLHLSEIIKGID